MPNCKKVMLAMFLAAFTAAACADSPSNVVEAPSLADFFLSDEPDQMANGVALALARDMGSQEFQNQVRDVLKESRLTEKKVELSTFLSTPAGEGLITRTASYIARAPEWLTERIDGIPALDFYVPLKDQRLTWLPGDPVAVGFAASPNDTVVLAYLSSGQQVHLTKGTIHGTGLTLFLLHHAEPKYRAILPAGELTAETIQEPHELGIGGRMQFFDEDGNLKEIELADLPLGTNPPIRVTPGPPPSELLFSTSQQANGEIILQDWGPGTLINWDYPFEGDGFGQCEVRTTEGFWDPSGTMRAYTQWSFSGLDCPFQRWNWYTYYGGLGRRAFDKGLDGDTSTREKFGRHMWEEDANYDDDWGTLYYYGDNPTEYCYDTYSTNPYPYDCYTQKNTYWQGNIVSYGGW